MQAAGRPTHNSEMATHLIRYKIPESLELETVPQLQLGWAGHGLIDEARLQNKTWSEHSEEQCV